MAAYRNAVQSGVSPAEFWGLTPYLTRHAAEALTDGRTARAWMTANLSRAKKMPKLDDLLTRRKGDRESMETRLKHSLKSLGRKSHG